MVPAIVTDRIVKHGLGNLDSIYTIQSQPDSTS